MVGNIQFTVNEEKQKELQRQARRQAIDEAKEKAKDLASDAGMRLGRIINVSEAADRGPSFYDRIVPLAGGASEETKVEPGETTITVSVTLTYEVL